MLYQRLGVLSHFENFYVETYSSLTDYSPIKSKIKKNKWNKMLLQGLGFLSHFKNFYVET